MSRRLAWGLVVLTGALVSAAVAFAAVGEHRGVDLPSDRPSMLALAAVASGAALLYATVGLLIARREPRNAIGWIFLGAGATLAALAFAYGYADLSLYGGDGWPAATWAGSFANWGLIPPVFIAPCFIAQLFPDGSPLPGRWRWVLWTSVGLAVTAVTLAALEPGSIDAYPAYANPAAPGGTAGDVVDGLNRAGATIAAPILLLGSLASLVVRFRRSRGVQRQQMKWLTFAGAVLVTAFALSFVVDPFVGEGALSTVLFLTGVAGLVFVPVAVAIAILRYRLYEIDRVISKTLVYGSLTAVLGAAYAGLVLAGQAVFSSFAGGSNLAIAVSTLVVAALFLPLRARVQGFVDRRFYRRRYDAQRTLAAFGARLREQVELDGLRVDLERVVRETMNPAHVSLWLRTGARP